MSTDRRRPLGRRAFTLLELLIVLAILVMAMAMSWPTVGGLLAKTELRSAAKQMRATLAKARLEAMESGSVQQFRYQSGTRRFETGPWDEATEDTSARPGSRSNVRAATASAEDALPAGVRFDEPARAGGASPPSEASEEGWSVPLLFFPNGRTSNARLQLHGRRDFFVTLTLRGVTGTVAIGELTRWEAPP